MTSGFFRNKRGSYIAEAAVVLPLVIIAIITIVLIVIFFYEQSVEESRMHIALRCHAGQTTGKIIYYDNGSEADAATLWDGNVSVDNRGLYKTVSAEEDVFMMRRGMLFYYPKSRLQGNWHAVDPAKIRRQK